MFNLHRYIFYILKNAVKRIIYFYEVVLAPYFFSFLYWPIYKLLKVMNVSFVVNIANGAGHVVAEIDHFLRLVLLDNPKSKKKYIWVVKPSPFYKAVIKFYSQHFHRVYFGYFYYLLFLPITCRYKSIILDCGISRMKWQVSKKNYGPNFPAGYIYRLSKKEGIKQLAKYYERCLKTDYFFPLKNSNFCPKDIFFKTDKKIALIQIKDTVRNATALPTAPETLLSSLEYLSNLEYQLVFIGREKIPKEFSRFSMINYSESTDANFENDIQIFYHSDLVITSGAGISFLADRMNKPLLYINSWQLQMSMPAKKTVMIPALLIDKKNGELLKFIDQINLYENKVDNYHEVFPKDSYNVRNASENEILEGLKELLKIPQELSAIQKKYKYLALDTPLFWGQSRCADYFLKEHEDLF